MTTFIQHIPLLNACSLKCIGLDIGGFHNIKISETGSELCQIINKDCTQPVSCAIHIKINNCNKYNKNINNKRNISLTL